MANETQIDDDRRPPDIRIALTSPQGPVPNDQPMQKSGGRRTPLWKPLTRVAPDPIV